MFLTGTFLFLILATAAVSDDPAEAWFEPEWFKGELPEGRHLRVDNKNFYFDIGQNNRGIYMKVSEQAGGRKEVKSNFRTAITVPEKCWTRFRDILADYCDKMCRAHQPADSHQTGASGAGLAGYAGGAGAGGAGGDQSAPLSSNIDTFTGSAPNRI